MIHGPSLGLGATLASVAIIASFLVFNATAINEQQELLLQPTPTGTTNEIQPKILHTVFFDNGSPVLGNPNALVTIVEFGDYQCHFCNVFFHETEPALIKNYIDTGKVKMIFKDFTIIGPDSVNAAHAAHCAGDQDKFWQYHDELYNNWTGENNGWASSENLLKFATNIGLDLDQFTSCMLNSDHAQIIEQSNADARLLELTGTPGFFIIGPLDKITKLHGAQPYETFEKILDSALER